MMKLRSQSTLSQRTRGLASLGGGTVVAATLVALYGLVNAWATLTSGVVVARTTSWRDGVQLPTGSGHPASATWPYFPMVDVEGAAAGARWLVQSADALTPLLCAACLAVLGIVLLRAGSARSVFEPGVLRPVRWLTGCLFALALVPSGLHTFGNNWLVASQGWPTTAAGYDPIAVWLPMFAGYLCLAFDVILRHGARLQADLDEVI